MFERNGNVLIGVNDHGQRLEIRDSVFFRPGSLVRPVVASVRMHTRIDRLTGKDTMANILNDCDIALAITKEKVTLDNRGDYTFWLVFAQGTIGWVNEDYLRLVMNVPEDLMNDVMNDLSSWHRTHGT